MNKDYIVSKSNYFIINSSYDLSVEEQRIILNLASMVQPEDEEFKLYDFKISEFLELLGIKDQSKYSVLPIITKELMKKVFEIKEEKTTLQVAWLSSAEYNHETGSISLEFSPRLKPYFLQLKSYFTNYKLSNILSMKSKYSPRLYEMLKMNEFNKKGFTIEVEELRRLFKAQNIYPKYNDFKKKIILKAQEELEEYSDIRFEFEEIKYGRKVDSIRFFIFKNSKKKISNNSKTIENKEVEDLEFKEFQTKIYKKLKIDYKNWIDYMAELSECKTFEEQKKFVEKYNLLDKKFELLNINSEI